MQPPIAIGALLQNRFRIVKMLGQGGFGRTYLATDQQRFNEQCAIKEYIPIQGNPYVLQKSKELFQREAETLYQIQHDQIPQFRALFDQDKRLFFVQDFVAGKPYNMLLRERLILHTTFSEAEVLHLLYQLLPVLSYIHSKQLVHRDISPDNIILRESDQLPVLIDFGVVKLATELERTNAPQTSQTTVVGKAGYAPIEQLKTGKAYPSSDLYALAVTAIVLLTGQSPNDLFDEMTVTWLWQKYLPAVNPLLAEVIDRMLSYRPQQRYQSADEVLAALNPLASLTAATSNLAQPWTNQTTLLTAQPPSSPPDSVEDKQHHSLPTTSANAQPFKPQIKSQNHRSNGEQAEVYTSSVQKTNIAKSPTSSTNQRQPHRAISQPASQLKSKSNQLMGVGIGLSIAVVVGMVALLTTANSLKQLSPSQSIVASQAISAAGTIPLTVTSLPTRVSGQVGSGRTLRYSINGIGDQGVALKVLSGKITAHMLHPDGDLPPGAPDLVLLGDYFFPYNGTFLLEVKAAQDTSFTFEINSFQNSGSTRGRFRPALPISPGGFPRQ